MRLDHARDPRRRPQPERKRRPGPSRPPLSRRGRWIIALGGLGLIAIGVFASGAFDTASTSSVASKANVWSPIDADIASHESYLNRVDSRIIHEHYIAHGDCTLIINDRSFDTAPTRAAFEGISSAFSKDTATLLDQYLKIVTQNDTAILKACSTLSSEALDDAAQTVDGQSDADSLAAAEAAAKNANTTKGENSTSPQAAHFAGDAGTGDGQIPDDAMEVAQTHDIEEMAAERQRILPLLRQSVGIDMARAGP